MKPVTDELIATAAQVLTRAFRDNAGARWVIRKDDKQEERLKALCDFCLSVSMEKKGAFITDANDGVTLIFTNNARQRLSHWVSSYFMLGQKCIGWDRAVAIILRERNIRRRRPKRPHLYCWMFGIERSQPGLGAAIEMKDFVIRMSEESRLPIVAETTAEHLLVLYARYGFKVYDSWHVPEQKLTLWFLIRELPI